MSPESVEIMDAKSLMTETKNNDTEKVIATETIQTFSGMTIDYNNPDPKQIVIEDIANALSKICRFSGQTNMFYSVAEHSVLVSRKCPPRFALYGLLHDAMEAYMSDLLSPLKNLCPNYLTLEKRMWEAVAKKFKMQKKLPKEVKEVDLRMLMTERDVVFNKKMLWEGLEHVEPYKDLAIMGYNHEDAKDMFLQRFEEVKDTCDHYIPLKAESVFGIFPLDFDMKYCPRCAAPFQKTGKS